MHPLILDYSSWWKLLPVIALDYHKSIYLSLTTILTHRAFWYYSVSFSREKFVSVMSEAGVFSPLIFPMEINIFESIGVTKYPTIYNHSNNNSENIKYIHQYMVASGNQNNTQYITFGDNEIHNSEAYSITHIRNKMILCIL